MMVGPATATIRTSRLLTTKFELCMLESAPKSKISINPARGGVFQRGSEFSPIDFRLSDIFWFSVEVYLNMGNQELLLTEKLMHDQNICTHYSRYGICKFGPACKFDHPLHISSSTTSGPDHRLPFSDSATSSGAGMAGSRNGTDVTSQPQPVHDSATTNGAGMAGSRNGADVTSQPQPVR